jgi:hypothetical protein
MKSSSYRLNGIAKWHVFFRLYESKNSARISWLYPKAGLQRE